LVVFFAATVLPFIILAAMIIFCRFGGKQDALILIMISIVSWILFFGPLFCVFALAFQWLHIGKYYELLYYFLPIWIMEGLWLLIGLACSFYSWMQ